MGVWEETFAEEAPFLVGGLENDGSLDCRLDGPRLTELCDHCCLSLEGCGLLKETAFLLASSWNTLHDLSAAFRIRSEGSSSFKQKTGTFCISISCSYMTLLEIVESTASHLWEQSLPINWCGLNHHYYHPSSSGKAYDTLTPMKSWQPWANAQQRATSYALKLSSLPQSRKGVTSVLEMLS